MHTCRVPLGRRCTYTQPLSECVQHAPYEILQSQSLYSDPLSPRQNVHILVPKTECIIPVPKTERMYGGLLQSPPILLPPLQAILEQEAMLITLTKELLQYRIQLVELYWADV